MKLIHINQLFTELVLKSQQSSINNLAIQILSKTGEMVKMYEQNATEAKNKLLQTRFSHKNIPIFDNVMTIIIQCENILKQRTQYDIQHKLNAFGIQIHLNLKAFTSEKTRHPTNT
jgi:hypothetical protein